MLMHFGMHHPRRGGFSLMEMLVVLAIIGLSAAIVAPRGSVMLDRITLHAVFFDFQRQMFDFRRDAYRREQAMLVVSPAPDGQVAIAPVPSSAPSDPVRQPLDLKEGFVAVFSQPQIISAAGVCAPTEVQIMRGTDRVMHLVAADDACTFERIS